MRCSIKRPRKLAWPRPMDLVVTACAIVIMACPSVVSAHEQAFTSGLPPAAARAELKSIGGLTYFPSRIPTRFRFKSAYAHRGYPNSTSARKRISSYDIRYCDVLNRCFWIGGMCEDEFGGGGYRGLARTLRGSSKELGRYAIEVYSPNSMASMTSRANYVSSPMADPLMKAALNSGRGECPSNFGRLHSFNGQGLSDDEARVVIESLKPLNP
jgi:hypothetical protein